MNYVCILSHCSKTRACSSMSDQDEMPNNSSSSCCHTWMRFCWDGNHLKLSVMEKLVFADWTHRLHVVMVTLTLSPDLRIILNREYVRWGGASRRCIIYHVHIIILESSKSGAKMQICLSGAVGEKKGYFCVITCVSIFRLNSRAPTQNAQRLAGLII